MTHGLTGLSLGHRPTPLCTYCLGLLPCYWSHVVERRPHHPQNLNSCCQILYRKSLLTPASHTWETMITHKHYHFLLIPNTSPFSAFPFILILFLPLSIWISSSFLSLLHCSCLFLVCYSMFLHSLLCSFFLPLFLCFCSVLIHLHLPPTSSSISFPSSFHQCLLLGTCWLHWLRRSGLIPHLATQTSLHLLQCSLMWVSPFRFALSME